MTLDDLSSALARKREVVLVEFCVPSGCPRCEMMRQPIDRLAAEHKDRFTVGRVNLNEHLQLAWELGLTNCPSYIAFCDGQEVFRAAHPTSADLIASGLDESLRELSAEELSIAAR